MGNIVVIAEKPSVAREIARVLGCRQQGEGRVGGNGYVVTWAVGHLVGLAQPQDMDPRWKSWDLGVLPMFPADWRLTRRTSRRSSLRPGRGADIQEYL